MDLPKLQHLAVSGGDDGFRTGVDRADTGLETAVEEFSEIPVGAEVGLADLGEVDAEDVGVEFEPWYAEEGREGDFVEAAPVVG